MTIKVRFFASLAETVGTRETECAHGPGMTVATVWQAVTGEPHLPEGILCAVNHSYCDLEQELADADEVAYFPPVTGG